MKCKIIVNKVTLAGKIHKNKAVLNYFTLLDKIREMSYTVIKRKLRGISLLWVIFLRKGFKKFAAAVICSVLLSGCSAVKDEFDQFIENDANIGKNAPAVGVTIADIGGDDSAVGEVEGSISEDNPADGAEDKLTQLISAADELTASMTVNEKIGQLILARCPEDPVDAMEQYDLCGFTFYAEDFEHSDPAMIRALIAQISAKAAVSPFFAVDEEGGTVVRISCFSQFRSEPYSSPQLLYNRGGTELLEIEGSDKAKLLLKLGINFNLAPVADISENPDSYIYSRTLGQGAESTAEGVAAIVRASDEAGLASCLKHFPGYGENTDTHKGASHDSRELYEFYNRDFLPFEAGMNATEDKTPAVMVGHTIYDAIDPDHPASLSPVIHEVLRNELGFEGVAVTDDLSMDALADFSSEHPVAVEAVLADNDLICVSDYEEAFSDIAAAVEEGVITEDMLNLHVRRIIVMKMQYGIIT